ncbi:MAG: 4-(cytidine 5'-diphospho)-2-C-methyl-D-erythritol kinase [Minwuia sp.]|nr:4-(cytidine 5'-diphospho)-2-C-methyl-D-erythritol kinase [Minwuia sp.]
MILACAAPAKLNLFLHVGGRRDDGLHLLQSLVCFADVGDRVTVERIGNTGAPLQFVATGPFAHDLDGDGGANLVVQAAVGLARATGQTTDGLRLTLRKNLPVASGIGGGSADAAATLRALEAFWGVALDPDARAALALALGADVPVCLSARPALLEGVGERLTPCAIPAGIGVLLVNPGSPVSTPAVFRAFAAAGTFTPSRDGFPSADRDGWFDELSGCHNDLQPAARTICQPIDAVLAMLARCDGVRLYRMSGSGATCFALFDTVAGAEGARHLVAQTRPDWWCAAGALHHQQSGQPFSAEC